MAFLDKIFLNTNEQELIGLNNELKSLYIYQKFKNENNSIILVTSNLHEAGQIYNSLTHYTNKVWFFPMDDFITSEAIAVSPEFKINLEDILIICDDLDTELGKIKIKYKGSSGGHNGLKNIENHLHSNEYKRIKIGISSNKNHNKIDYVIGKMPKEDLNILEKVTDNAEQILTDFLNISFDNLMNKYNRKEIK